MRIPGCSYRHTLTVIVPRVLPIATPTANPAFKDSAMQNLIPPSGRSKIVASDRICKSTQQTQNVTQYSPLLQATPTSKILLRYQENGHVTLRDRDVRKISPGTVFVYGTNESSPEDTFMDIFGVWTEDGTGGDGRGVLLAEAPFDDGACYQINDGKESARRQALSQRLHTENEGDDLWCGVEVPLPDDITSGTVYTLYWVWNWPTWVKEYPQHWQQEVYTSCIDIQVA